MTKHVRHSRVPRTTEPKGDRGTQRDPAALLLASGLTGADVERLLKPYGFKNLKRADENLQAMAGEPRPRELLAKIVKELLLAVSETADPDQALNYWERFLQEGVNRVQLFEYLRGSPRMLHLLCCVFGNSPAMAQTLIRDPILVYWLLEEQVLSRRVSRAALAQALHGMLGNLTRGELKLEALRRFRRREILRIGVRDLLRLADVKETIAALSSLAAILIEAAYRIVETDLRSQYGTPRHRDRSGRWIETGFAVMAMGKLGGGELNYSSDVDLIYVYESDEGQTVGSARRAAARSDSISNEEYFEYLARGVTRALADVTQEGYVFRVDLRLRAEGGVGRLARSLEDYARYYRTRGQGWERMALLKASPIAGSRTVGNAFMRVVKPFVFQKAYVPGSGWTPSGVIDEVKSIKAMINTKMAERRQERRNVKLGVGGIRELEFVVQAIQLLCGARLPGLCDRSTLGSLGRFRQHGLLTGQMEEALTQSYLFLRDVEHKLQMVHDLQTHALPEEQEELRRCAIRLGYAGPAKLDALDQFVGDYRRHTMTVNRLFRELVETPDRCSLLRLALRRVSNGKRGRRVSAHR